MTTDTAAMSEVERVAFEATPYLQVGIPGLPYSAVRIPIVEDLEEQSEWVARAMNAAQLLANAYHDTFPEYTSEPFSEPARSPARPAAGGGPRANGRAQAPSRQAPRPARAPQGLDPQLIVEGYCPEHDGVKARPSILKYQEIETDDEGYERYAKYWCPGQENGTGQNHNLYARQLLP